VIGAGHRWLGLLVGGLLLGTGLASAQPVIPPGQEEEVLALLAPRGFGSDPVDGWRLADVRIERSLIRLTVAGPDETATLRLLHPEVSDSAERTASFALEREGSDAARAALDPWVAAIRANDGGDFWAGMRSERARHGPRAESVATGDGSPVRITLATVAPVVALLLVLFAGFWERRRFGIDALGPSPSPVGERWHRRALALALVGVAALALVLAGAVPPLHPDTNRDLLLARDCLERGVCFGPSTSFGSLEQHAGWVRLLAFLRALGLDPVGAHRALIAMNAIGAGVLALVAARRTNLLVAALVASVAFSWLVWAADFPIFWNPTLAPLAYALLYAGVLSRRWAVAGTLAGVGAMAAVETHVAGLVATAVLVLGLRVLADRPGRAVALALGLFGALEWALSGPSIAINLGAPIARLALPALILGLGASWLLGGWLRRGIEGRSRRELVVLALAAVGTVGPPLVVALAAGHFLSARYFTVAIVPLVGLLAAALIGLSARGRAGRAAALVLAAVAIASSARPWSNAADRQYYTLDEVAVLADELAVRERYASVRLALRGPLTNLLGESFAVWAEDASFDPSLDEPTVRVVRVADPEALPSSWRSLPLPSGAALGISEQISWLRPTQAELCLTGSGPPECVTLTAAHWRSFGGDRDSYERHSSGLLPVAERLRERVSSESPGSLSLFVRIPLRAEGGSERILQLFDDRGSEGGWRVARVEGVEHRGELGGQRIVLVGGGEGTLTLEHTASVERYVPSLLLDALEVSPEERPLLEVVCADFSGC
jgi:hypothetical protein